MNSNSETEARNAAREVVQSFNKLLDVLFDETHRKLALMETRLDAAAPQPRRWVNKKELATHLGVCTRTIDNGMTSMRIPYYKIGRSVRFNLEEVDAHLRFHRAGPWR